MQAGEQVGPYILVRLLGRGTFGVVWLGERRTELSTTYFALKFPHGEIELPVIRQEVALWVRASGHPNVLPIIEANIYPTTTGPRVVIVSEYADGGSLQQWLTDNNGRFGSAESAIQVTIEILSGLEYLHSQGIIHRDLKPDNILLQGGKPRLGDFGISRVLTSSHLSTGWKGTPAYMSPEAFTGKYDQRSDLWSVGIMLYQFLVGQNPFGNTEWFMIIDQIQSQPIQLSLEAIPEELHPILSRVLQRDRSYRFATAFEMKEALQLVLQTLKTEQSRPPKSGFQSGGTSSLGSSGASYPSKQVFVRAVQTNDQTQDFRSVSAASMSKTLSSPSVEPIHSALTIGDFMAPTLGSQSDKLSSHAIPKIENHNSANGLAATLASGPLIPPLPFPVANLTFSSRPKKSIPWLTITIGILVGMVILGGGIWGWTLRDRPSIQPPSPPPTASPGGSQPVPSSPSASQPAEKSTGMNNPFPKTDSRGIPAKSRSADVPKQNPVNTPQGLRPPQPAKKGRPTISETNEMENRENE
ncbi:MAG: serine/threonine protein kinase [Acidobacteria bacterium]|nr:serine/threonine protein kinase [Acidobacteriota bacterium]